MCGYLIIVKLVAKTRLSCKCYTNGSRMNILGRKKLMPPKRTRAA
jgi:hypothetical protein